MDPKEVTLKDGATPRKVVATSRGSAKHWNDGGFEYSPYESTGESSREGVVRDGDSVAYVTKGKNPYRVVTLKVRDDDPALCARMQEQLNGFWKASTKDLQAAAEKQTEQYQRSLGCGKDEDRVI